MKIEIGPYPNTSALRQSGGTGEPDPTTKRSVSVEIHDYDTWSADHTLALVIAPLLKHYRDNAGGADSIGATEPEDFPGVGDTRETNDAKRWRALIDELVWTFERIASEETNDDAAEARITNGLRLFGKYYRCLWT